jgi:hypothetical protein
MQFLDDGMISGLLAAETSSFPSPVPTQIVASDEYLPTPQTAAERSRGAAHRDERSACEAPRGVAASVLHVLHATRQLQVVSGEISPNRWRKLFDLAD